MILAVTINFTVPGKPISYKRVTHGGRPHNPTIYREYRSTVALIARSAMRNSTCTDKPVSVVVKVFHPVKADSKQSGDIDNHLKSILDALNGIAFKDDGQVVQAEVYKFKDKINPRVEVSVTDEL